MPAKQTVTTPIHPQLVDCPPELRAYVASLEADRAQLHDLVDYPDPGEAVTLMTALGESFIRYAAAEDIAGRDDGPHYIDTLAGLFVRIGRGVVSRLQEGAAQKRVV